MAKKLCFRVYIREQFLTVLGIIILFKEIDMADKKPNKMVVPQGGMLREFLLRLKLIGRLMTDRRVNPLLKLIPLASVAYLVFPFDLVSIIPGISALDDLAIVSLGGYLFVELCPQIVVKEHMDELQSNVDDTDDVIDAEATDVDDK
jgi:uncharacterized membrane protein YkvA (DUF1232 family)